LDGLDEVICPVDFDETHLIRDKDFARYFSRVPKGVELVWISDSCHSGDLSRDLLPDSDPQRPISKYFHLPLDLNWRMATIEKETKTRALTMPRAATKLNVALVAGCQSDQSSMDTTFEGRRNGALTYYLLKTLKQPDGLQLRLSEVVANSRKAILRTFPNQEPQLEGSAEIARNPFLQNKGAKKPKKR